MKVIKKTLWILLIFLTLIACVSDVMCIGIKLFGKEKSILYTLKGGTLKGVEDVNKKYIFNFRYFKNEDNSGIECFEFLSNYFMDDDVLNDKTTSTQNNNEKVFSFGIQLINPTFTSKQIRQGSAYINEYKTVETYFSPYYAYNMYDNQSYIIDSYNPEEPTETETINKCRFIIGKKYFLITVGNDIFKMTFKEEFETIGKYAGLLWQRFPIKLHNNFPYFLANMFTSIKDSAIGENQTKEFEFIDYFDFCLYNKTTGTYSEPLDKESNDLSNVNKYMKQYFAVKIDCYDYGMTKSTESLFGCVFGNYTYNTSKEDNTTDYAVGKNIIVLDSKNFDYRFDDETGYYLVLKENAKIYCSNFKNSAIHIKLDMHYLELLGIPDISFIKEKSNFGELELYKLTKEYPENQNTQEIKEVEHG